ncbi:hypothetical protein [Chroococcidiopsis sp. CCNUC1]|nr:hypothetical protein [Chroococcidiopsis sp. CCNUC1]URD47792.1 hypothetical protein M5J74_15755 [Chroococcidiopsis sp. CCNUC1]
MTSDQLTIHYTPHPTTHRPPTRRWLPYTRINTHHFLTNHQLPTTITANF